MTHRSSVGGASAKGTLPIIDHEVVVPAKINNNRSVGRVVGVEGVEHVTGVNVAPNDVVGGTIPGQQTKRVQRDRCST